jgi:hypothetical protein
MPTRVPCREGAVTASNGSLGESSVVAPSVSQPSRDEAIRLMRGGLAKAMRDLAASYVMPICWITARDRKPWILDNGSAFLLDCGADPFLVTATMSIRAFVRRRTNTPTPFAWSAISAST